MGRWALREACRQAKAWQDAGLPAIPIAVNVSALQFRTAGFLEDILRFLHETELSSRYLELELTESALMVDIASTTSLLEVLKQKGLILKVDDFGTGPSSLSYLQRCPVDVLKIDQSFVADIEPAPDERAAGARGDRDGQEPRLPHRRRRRRDARSNSRICAPSSATKGRGSTSARRWMPRRSSSCCRTRPLRSFTGQLAADLLSDATHPDDPRGPGIRPADASL